MSAKSTYTDFGPGSPPSALEWAYPELMAFARDDETAVTYFPQLWEFGIPVLDCGCSVMKISHEPWTGAALPSSLRDEWFAAVTADGFDLDNVDFLPVKYHFEGWWVERGL